MLIGLFRNMSTANGALSCACACWPLDSSFERLLYKYEWKGYSRPWFLLDRSYFLEIFLLPISLSLSVVNMKGQHTIYNNAPHFRATVFADRLYLYTPNRERFGFPKSQNNFNSAMYELEMDLVGLSFLLLLNDFLCFFFPRCFRWKKNIIFFEIFSLIPSLNANLCDFLFQRYNSRKRRRIEEAEESLERDLQSVGSCFMQITYWLSLLVIQF